MPDDSTDKITRKMKAKVEGQHAESIILSKAEVIIHILANILFFIYMYYHYGA